MFVLNKSASKNAGLSNVSQHSKQIINSIYVNFYFTLDLGIGSSV